MKTGKRDDMDRRQLLTRAAPACAFACLGFQRLPEVLAAEIGLARQEGHKFDVTQKVEMSTRRATQMQHAEFFNFMRNIRREIGDQELIRLLNLHSSAVGRQVGAQQAQNSPDTEFQTFVATFRPPRYAAVLTHEVVEDAEGVFELRVTECVWASVFREAGLDGEIGHAAVCNMDYHWPSAFNPNFKMERTKTLMQGHDVCNHRYIDTT